ncbi:type II toxin-antitoxin system HicA family toxin [Mycetocola lacteus]|uniref:Type II toxin-antitoxin system HicA family toxin n=1 Tax=Mycetocola lacteus TaxID=76637 RepID=A0A3L7AHX9_9MICO|nr:type II toxin-antitoxin system HicA family toxin [Mycetocola lacteus]
MVRAVKQRELERFLASRKWTLLRTKGGHNVWGSPNGTDSVAIPTHGIVSPGVVRQVMKKLPDTPSSWK